MADPTDSTAPKDAPPKPPAQGEGSWQGPRWSLAGLALTHGLIFAWAASKLPWSQWSTFAIVCGALAFGHFATALSAAARTRFTAWIWRGTSIFALGLLLWLGWQLTSSASYLAGLYGDLGKGLGAAVLAVLGLAALLTLPLSIWGLAATWDARWNRAAAGSVAALALVWVGGAWQTASAAQATPLPLPGDGERPIYDQIADAIPAWEELPPIPLEGPPRKNDPDGPRPKLKLPPLWTTEPVACVPAYDAVDTGQAYAVLTYFVPASEETIQRRRRSAVGWRLAPVEPASRCVQAPREAIVEAIAEQLRAEAMAGPMKIDLLSGMALLRSRNFILDMVALRPGLDGICDADRCLMPWQLTATNQFIFNEPVGWIPDFRFGVSPVRLQRALGGSVPKEVLIWDRERRRPKTRKKEERDQPLIAPDGAEEWGSIEGLLRVETVSIVISDDAEVRELRRLHEREVPLSQHRLALAQRRAERYIAEAQLANGRFTYTLDPFTGKRRTKSWNLPRQAGTTLVMCELGTDEHQTRTVATRSLAFMAKHARAAENGDAAVGGSKLLALIKNEAKTEAHLGSTALPGISYFACREHVGDRFDTLAASLVRYLLAMQRPDGSFYPKYDVATGEPIDGPEPMYAGGQAIFTLTLAEKLSIEDPEAAAAMDLPDTETLHDATEAAMNYYAGPYWDNFLRDFFWLEENWHCLAARASLGHHRNEGYEQFCVDYMAYKSRVPLRPDSRVAEEFVGGYSLGNILTPVNTPTVGYGEGLAASMAIKQARGEDVSEDVEHMKAIIAFALRQQWNPVTCFACTPKHLAVGGFSESMSAPEIRIDYTQHAWAALGHGGALIWDHIPPSHEMDRTRGEPEEPEFPGLTAPPAQDPVQDPAQ